MGNSSSSQSSQKASSAAPAQARTAGCPVPHGDAESASRSSGTSQARGIAYNVYAQPLDPTNNMPAAPAQARAPGQTKDLSTDRVQSSIRKGGTAEGTTWLYPSPQMFWNALVRKRKAENVDEGDMPVVVSIHNEMNERAWKLLLEWEAKHTA